MQRQHRDLPTLTLLALLMTLATASTSQATGPAALHDLGLQPTHFEAGRTALHAGNGARAVEHLALAVSSSTGIALADARHLYARALLLERRPSDARAVLLDALDAAKAADNPTSLPDHLHFLLARSLEALGNHSDAASEYDAVVATPESSFVLEAAYRAAVMRQLAGELSAARSAFDEFVDEWPDAPQANEARVRLAELEIGRGQPAAATRLYRRIRRLSPDSRAGLEAGLGLERLAAAGHGPSPAQARAWRLEDVEWLVDERRFREALGPLEALVAEAGEARDRDVESEALELLARSHSELDEIGEALALYERLGERGIRPIGPSRLAFMQGLEGDLEAAERTLLRAHYQRRGRSFYTELGDLFVQFGRYAEAESAYRSAIDGKRKRKRSASKRARHVPDDLECKLAWAVARRGEQPDVAVEMFEAIAKTQRRKRSWARYWRARTLADAGSRDDAIAAFEELRTDEPLSYYGIQAFSRLAEIRGEAPPQEIASAPVPSPDATFGPAAFSVDDLAGVTPLEATARPSTVHWPEGPYAAAFDQSPDRASQADRQIALDALAVEFGPVAHEARRAAELHRLGFVDEALAELRVVDADLRAMGGRGWLALRDRVRSDLLDNRRDKKARGGEDIRGRGRRTKKEAKAFWSAARDGALKLALRRAQVALGDAYSLRRTAFEMEGALGTRPDTPERMERWKRAYPIAWPDAMERFTRLNGVPAYFLYGIMVVESTFHPGAISVSDAYGLLQVIPRTGRRVADELGLTEFVPELLLRPETAIYMGSHYMGRLLAKFGGQEPLAAASYNAGPHRVAGWLRANPNRPMDAFIEEIPFRQARRYTRSVLQQTARYRRIYHGDKAIYVANQLHDDCKPDPNY